MLSKVISATIHLTHHCNLRCSYCYTGEKLPIAMHYDTIDASIDFILNDANDNNAKTLNITFFGGEPLIEKDKIFYIIDQFDRLKNNITVSYRMSTNGTLMTPKLMKKLMDNDVFVSLSIDGHPDVHDIHRVDAGGKPTSAKVANAAKLMLDLNRCTNVTCVITPETAGDLMKSIEYIYGLGFRYITTTLDYSANWNDTNFIELEKSYSRLGRWYEKMMMKEERFYLSFFDERIRTRTYKPLKASEKCGMGDSQYSIAPNGELYPCIQFVKTQSLPEFIIGHVDSGFDQKCQNHIKGKTEKPKLECTGCALESRCSKWCSCINYMSTGTVEKASHIVCHNEKLLIKIVEKTAYRLWKKSNNMFVHKHYNPDYAIISHIEINL